MKKSEITEAMIDNGDVELCVFAMIKDDNGYCTLAETDEGADFFDVELHYRAPDGSITVIEEHEDLSFEDAKVCAINLIAEIGFGLQETWEYA